MNITSKTNTSAETSSSKEPETTTTVTENRGLFCKKCGKAVEIDAVYCKYCGAKLAGISFFRIAGGIMPAKETVKKVLICLLKWVLVAGGCMLFGILYWLLWEYMGYKIDSLSLCDMDYFGYSFPPFVAYCIYRIICYFYSLHKKLRVLLVISLTFIVTVFIAWQTWDCVEREKREYEEQIQENERYKINRTFLNCTFGDSMIEVQKKLEASNRHYEFYEGSSNTIMMTNVTYGAYKIDTLCFNFHNDNFYRTYMEFTDLTTEDINNDLTYKDLKYMLNEKYRGSNPFYDDQTEVTLKQYFKEYFGQRSNYRIVITYYDKQTKEAIDSQKKEAKEQGF